MGGYFNILFWNLYKKQAKPTKTYLVTCRIFDTVAISVLSSACHRVETWVPTWDTTLRRPFVCGRKIVRMFGPWFILRVAVESRGFLSSHVVLMYKAAPFGLLFRIFFCCSISKLHTDSCHPKILIPVSGRRGTRLVEALRYKPEGRGFDSRLSHWNFSLT